MYQLELFEYENDQDVRTFEIDGEVWFVGIDVCKALKIKNPSNVYNRLDEDDLRTMDGVDKIGRKTDIYIVNESGLYNLIFESRKPEAKKFKRWITSEVLPQIRKTGSYSLPDRTLPVFVKRFNDNWDSVDYGYFSVINELFIRFYGRLEQVGYTLPDRSVKGQELRPDVSVGRMFANWLKQNHPEKANEFKMYPHKLPDDVTVDARQYKNSVWPEFVDFVENVWIKKQAHKYLRVRDPKALEFLPKLIPDLRSKKGRSTLLRQSAY